MRRRYLSAMPVAAALIVAACDFRTSPPDMGVAPPAAASAEPAQPPAAMAAEAQRDLAGTARRAPTAGISWFAGDVADAFAAASAADKPILLYWGAVWCPYCADLEAHVLTREDVQSKLDLFVPVYLDGDAPGAQRWGDRFAVAGYPTMLALAPDGTELARIAGGMDLTLYAEMLDLVLADLRPIDDVLRAGDQGAFSADDCRRLAYNGWGLDDAASDDGAALAERLAAAAELCAGSGGAEQARLDVHAASFAVADGGDAPIVAMLVQRVRDIVAQREIAVTIADVLRGLDEDFFAAVRRYAPDHAAGLLDDWAAVMDAASTDPRYGQGDRLAALRSKIEAVGALAPEGVTAELAEEARRRIDAALNEVGSSAARRGTINSAINLLAAIGDFERARQVALGELEASRTPYYPMGDIAWLDEQLGRYDDAVSWLEGAYRASSGPATRFQWGTNYVRGLIRMKPDDTAAIREAALEVLGELDGSSRIYRRSRARLETLDAELQAWSEARGRDDTVAVLRQRMDEICGRIPADETDAHASCSAFLSTVEPL